MPMIRVFPVTTYWWPWMKGSDVSRRGAGAEDGEKTGQKAREKSRGKACSDVQDRLKFGLSLAKPSLTVQVVETVVVGTVSSATISITMGELDAVSSSIGRLEGTLTGIADTVKEMRDDIKDLQRFRWQAVGALGVIMAAVEFFVHKH